MAGRILPEVQARFVRSFDPSEVVRPPRPHPLSSDRVERAAMAIYGVVTNTADPDKLAEKWGRVAKPITKERHRREAEAALRAAI